MDDDRITRRRALGRVAAVGTAGLVAGCDDATTRTTTETTSTQSATRSTTQTTTTTTTAPTTTADDDRPAGFATPDPPAFDTPDRTDGSVEIFRSVPYERTPDGELSLDLYWPAGASAVPLVVYVHGGAWRRGSPDSYVNWHARQGVACAAIEYRLSGTAPYPAPVRDVAAAVTWLRRQAAGPAGVDPERVVLRGSSAGAHLAALLAVGPDVAAHHPRGIEPSVDVAGLVGISGIYEFQTDGGTSQAIRSLLDCGPRDCPDRATQASPITHVSEGDPPALLWHGQSDDVVSVAQSRAFRDALTEAGVDVELLSPAEAGHVAELGGSWAEGFRTAEREFLQRTVGLS